MPSKTKKQAKFMAAVANSPKFAKKVGVPQSVGKEFAKADKEKEDNEEEKPEEDEETFDEAVKNIIQSLD
jgi:ribosomal protein L12E/L44/L45/RPP1/RPP2